MIAIKKVFFFLLVLLFCITAQTKVKADEIETEIETETIVNRQIEIMHMEDMEKAVSQMEGATKNPLIEEFSFSSAIKKMLSGEFEFSLTHIASYVIKQLFSEVFSLLYIFKNAFVILLLSSVLKSLNASFMGKSVGELTFYTCYMVLVYSLMSSFSIAAEMVTQVVQALATGMKLMIPSLAAITAATGKFGEASLMAPVVLSASTVITNIVLHIFIPMVTAIVTVEMVNHISEKGFITHLAELFKNTAAWGLKGMAILYMAVLSIQKIASPAVSGVVGKTAKAVVGAVPVIGNVMSGAVETAAVLTGAVKSASGAAAVIFILISCLLPIVKLIAMILIYKLTAALAEPFCEERLLKGIEAAADFSCLLLGGLFLVVAMFVFSVILLIGVF